MGIVYYRVKMVLTHSQFFDSWLLSKVFEKSLKQAAEIFESLFLVLNKTTNPTT